MTHGQFYRSDELVAAVHRAAGGIFAGFRAAHADGRFYAGTFTATPVAKTLSRAAHFQGTPVPVTARRVRCIAKPRSPVTAMATTGRIIARTGITTTATAITTAAACCAATTELKQDNQTPVRFARAGVCYFIRPNRLAPI